MLRHTFIVGSLAMCLWECHNILSTSSLQELVQVESLAQVGVQLLLFTLGLEFSLQKLKAVRSVALIGVCLKHAVLCFAR